MKKSRFAEEQIVFALKQAELNTSVPEVCRKLGIFDATFYTWRKNTVKFLLQNSGTCGSSNRAKNMRPALH